MAAARTACALVVAGAAGRPCRERHVGDRWPGGRGGVGRCSRDRCGGLGAAPPGHPRPRCRHRGDGAGRGRDRRRAAGRLRRQHGHPPPLLPLGGRHHPGLRRGRRARPGARDRGPGRRRARAADGHGHRRRHRHLGPGPSGAGRAAGHPAPAAADLEPGLPERRRRRPAPGPGLLEPRPVRQLHQPGVRAGDRPRPRRLATTAAGRGAGRRRPGRRPLGSRLAPHRQLRAGRQPGPAGDGARAWRPRRTTRSSCSGSASTTSTSTPPPATTSTATTPGRPPSAGWLRCSGSSSRATSRAPRPAVRGSATTRRGRTPGRRTRSGRAPDVQVVTIDPFDIAPDRARIRVDRQQLRLAGAGAPLRAGGRRALDHRPGPPADPRAGPLARLQRAALPGRRRGRGCGRSSSKYGVDVYLCGEVHDVTATSQDGILQLAHGGAFQFGLTTYAAARRPRRPARRHAPRLRGPRSATPRDHSRLWETVRGGLKKWVRVGRRAGDHRHPHSRRHRCRHPAQRHPAALQAVAGLDPVTRRVRRWGDTATRRTEET